MTANRSLRGLAALAALGLGGLVVRGADPATSVAGAVEPDRDDRLVVGEQTFRANCLICHAEEMTARQRITPAQWEFEVRKMIGWGAPVPEEHVVPLVEFLVAQYPADAPLAPPERMTPEEALADILPRPDPAALPAGDATRGGVLYAAQCATCHGADARGADLGPNLVEVPILTRPAEYEAVVARGLRRMPGFAAALGPQPQADILAWLRERRWGGPDR